MKWIFIFSFFIFSACGRDSTKPQQRTKPKQRTNPPKKEQAIEVHQTDDCSAKVISQANASCFYVLPALKHGKTIVMKYEDTENINTTGITIGRGKWRCEKGSWKVILSPLCIGCLPGKNLEYCIKQWDSQAQTTYGNNIKLQ